VPYVPNVGDKTAPRDLQEAAEYYLTPRGQHPNTPNKMLLTSLGNLAAFSGFDGAETLLTQPLLVVAGAAMVAQAATANTLVQSMVPDALRGRIMSMFTLVLMGAMPLGNLLIGALAGLIGTMAAVATFGVALCAAIGVITLARRELYSPA